MIGGADARLGPSVRGSAVLEHEHTVDHAAGAKLIVEERSAKGRELPERSH